MLFLAMLTEESSVLVKGGVEVERRTVGRNCSVPFG